MEKRQENPNGQFLALYVYDHRDEESPLDFLSLWNPVSVQERIEFDNYVRSYQHYCYDKLEFDDDIPNLRELPKFPKVELVEVTELKSGHLVAVKKTFWLSVFQRMLKKRYNKESAGRYSKRMRYN